MSLAVTAGARATTYGTTATTGTEEMVGVAAAEEVAHQLVAGSGAKPKTRTSTPTAQAQEGMLYRVSNATLEANNYSREEPRFGRLRGRSASPASDEEGDGRFGFAEKDAHAGPRRYPSTDRWTHDRANHDRTAGSPSAGRWQKDAFFVDTSPMGNHHRSNAIDVSHKPRGGESLLSRMTKNGQPLAPQQPQQKRSLADRITRDDDPEELFGRLKNDDRDSYTRDFSEPARPRRGLADRITRDTDINIRGQGRRKSQEGINIRGSAERSAGGFNIRGVASGA
jgi:hypothetical protein